MTGVLRVRPTTRREMAPAEPRLGCRSQRPETHRSFLLGGGQRGVVSGPAEPLENVLSLHPVRSGSSPAAFAPRLH